MSIRRLLRRQHGLALPLALGIIIVLSISGGTLVYYSTSNARSAGVSKTNESTFSLSESALNNAMAVLANPTNNALDPETLPNSEATASSAQYENGTAKWWGVLDRAEAVWTVSAVGVRANPTGPGTAQVRRVLTAKVPVTPNYVQPLNNPVWDYLYAGHTGSTCDQSLNNNITGSSRMYVAGNLCLSPNVQLAQSTVIVRGNVNVQNNAAIGASTNMSTRVETYVGGNCLYSTGSWVTCTGNQDSRHIYSKLTDGVTTEVNHVAPVIAPPVADFAKWYENAIPGPSQSCTTSSGTPPMFDNNYPSRDNSASTVDLTPASSYICRVGPGASTSLSSGISAGQSTVTVASATGFPTSQFHIRIDDEVMTVNSGFGTTTWSVTRGASGTTAASHAAGQTVLDDDATPSGELSWNATTKSLTVKGTILIDGSAKISNSALNAYNGQATLYLSGTLRGTGSLCASVSGSTCAFASWNPDTELLMIVANGNGGSGVNPGDSIQFDNNTSFQGGLYGTNIVEFGNNVSVDGPIVGSQILLSNNLATNAFPTIHEVPVGLPSNNDVYAQPNPPELFAG